MALFVLHALWVEAPFSYARNDNGWLVWTTVSLAKDKDLDLRNQLNNNIERVSDQIALGVNGEWFPLHEPLISLIAVPFYLLSGIKGTLLTSIFVALLLTQAMSLLLRLFTDQWLAAVLSFLTAATSLILPHSGTFSLDMFGALLAFAAYVALSYQRVALAGFLYSIAVMGRISNLFVYPSFLLLLWLLIPKPKKINGLFFFHLSAVPLGVLFFFLNYLMYGSIFSYSYQNWIAYDSVCSCLIKIPYNFDPINLQRLKVLLFDFDASVWRGAPLLLLALPFGSIRAIRLARPHAVFFFSVFFILLLFAAVNPGAVGGIGNRYVFLIIPLSSLCLLFAVEGIFRRRKDDSSPNRIAERICAQ